jgi:transposase
MANRPKLIINPEALTTVDVAKILGVSRWTVIRWAGNVLPEPRMVGNKRTWTMAQVEEIRPRVKG